MSDNFLVKLGGLLFSLVIPDFQLFNVIDSVIQGQIMPLAILGKLTLIGLFYVVFYIIGSWLIFARKEF